MKVFSLGIRLLAMISVLAIYLGLLGCGVAITQQAAQRAVSDARMAVSDAKDSSAQLYSTDKMKKAERFLREAEEAVSRGRKQRAYTLATRAEETARMAEQEARVYLEDSGISTVEHEQSLVRLQTRVSPDLPPTVSQTVPAVPPMPPSKQMPSESSVYEMPPQQVPGFAAPSSPGMTLLDEQSRVQNVIQALVEAQKAIDSARIVVAKAQVEIGLSMSDFTVQQLRLSGVSTDMINVVNSWYDYARRAAQSGNYEEASRAIERAQGYAQSFSKPMR